MMSMLLQNELNVDRHTFSLNISLEQRVADHLCLAVYIIWYFLEACEEG